MECYNNPLDEAKLIIVSFVRVVYPLKNPSNACLSYAFTQWLELCHFGGIHEVATYVCGLFDKVSNIKDV